MRFNPPPNWPPPPPGWAPEPGWQPDPAWGPPPPGWPLWVADAPPRRPATAVWAGLIGLVVIVAVAVAVVLVTRGGPAETASPAGPQSNAPAEQPALTDLSTSLLVDKSAFPALGTDADWSSSVTDAPTRSDESAVRVSPPECKEFFADDSYTSRAFARLGDVTAGEEVLVRLDLGAKRFDTAEYLDTCRSVTATGGDAGDTTVATRPLDLTDLPDWATAYTVDLRSGTGAAAMEVSARLITGYYRGLKVEVESNHLGSGSGSVDDDALVALFNAQVDKLAAAP